MIQFNPADLVALLPTIIFTLGACALLLSEVFLTQPARAYQAALCAVTCVLAGVSALPTLNAAPHAIFGGMGASDPFSALISMMVALGLFISTLTATSFLSRQHIERGEFYALCLFGAAGMSLLALSSELITLFVSLEVMSVAVYALTAYLRRGQRSSEAAFKYFILGAFASALYLYGAALVYGATGTTVLREIAIRSGSSGPLLTAGVMFLAAGFAFKVAAVPFHMWTPDVYEGSPTPVTSFMAMGVKAAAFAALLRTLVVAFPGANGNPPVWGDLLETLAVLTMLFGNLLAVPQRNVKRMLAYSSIAHAGYLLLGVAAARSGTTATASAGILFYLLTYTVTATGAFALLAAVERDDQDGLAAWDLDRFAGLAQRRPGVALAATVFLVSLAGIPPAGGFMGKLYVFRAAVDAGLVNAAIIGILTSVLGAYYYLRVVVYMFMRPMESGQQFAPRSASLDAALWLSALLVVVLGVGPGPWAELARASALAFGG